MARPVPESIPILRAGVMEDWRTPEGTWEAGCYWLEVACDTYEDYKRLPGALEYKGRIYGRTGRNSDTGRAYYRTGVECAKARDGLWRGSEPDPARTLYLRDANTGELIRQGFDRETLLIHQARLQRLGQRDTILSTRGGTVLNRLNANGSAWHRKIEEEEGA